MDVDMWMYLLKRLPLDKKYRLLAMKGLTGLFRFHEGFKNCTSQELENRAIGLVTKGFFTIHV